ncbi:MULTISPECIES: HAD-IA family hydrolase [Gammaproteobacteria]|jgi:putative hydrolase of the HAD superfamily|uniref:HAD-IA family hydrolase n=1 Tax=Vreelandella halophila TaxID=86177 RepID=A0A9X5B6B3_9GAMM|nr:MULTISPECIES: HAD-IA family hydrolase [Gammaproteobacteria]KAA8983632.1 HAD-IA family hydrolase [Halospina sp. K52047b]MYL27329.1 HAD-IA family hydrolase [Halomonas utahensis]MYL76008.1 HAD-IA family hydrolase [Halomonas sp. 22501_18_FS]
MTALTLDLDETLWQLDGVIERAERATHEFLLAEHPALASAYPPERMRALRIEVAEADPSLQHDVTALRLRTLERAARHVEAPLRIAEAAFEVFMEARHRVTLYPDALPMLDRLLGRLPLVALTNGNADVHRIGMGHYFVAAHSAVEVGAAKPERPMFEAAASSTGVPLETLIHVGDDPVTDVAGAARHGLRPVWLNRSGLPWPEDVPRVAYDEIRGLDELPGLLRRLRPDLQLS